jgi:hypothetical protein
LLSLGLAASVSAVVLIPVAGESDAVGAAHAPVSPAAVIPVEPLWSGRTATARRGAVSPRPLDSPTPARRPVHEPSAVDPAAANQDYGAKLARYGEEVHRYDRELDRYSEQLNDYSRANSDFIRKARDYRDRMAEIGPDPPPGTSLPAYPAEPAVPAPPAVPSTPAKPVVPPALHRNR